MKLLLSFLIAIPFISTIASAQTAFIRVNQAGYLPNDRKVAIAFSSDALKDAQFLIRDNTGAIVLRGKARKTSPPEWGPAFPHSYEIDGSRLRAAGSYRIEIPAANAVSPGFRIGKYPGFHEDLLFFMRQQRCGYNPFLDISCHLQDGKAFYAPFPDGTFVDAVGGWHDAGDQLKYLITASNATARMLLAYELQKGKFGDFTDALGRETPNGVPDILDEAFWGLTWIHKLHPRADLLIHQ